MEKTLSELNQLQVQINFEKDRYKKAIIENKTLEEVKIIYLMIRDLEKREDELMQIAQVKLLEQQNKKELP